MRSVLSGFQGLLEIKATKESPQPLLPSDYLVSTTRGKSQLPRPPLGGEAGT